MVAIKDGKPVKVPPLICENREDKIKFLEARLRRELRSTQAEGFERLSSILQAADDLEPFFKTESLVKAL